LFLAGIFLCRSAKEIIKQAGTLTAYCGASSMAFGGLWGSFFGLEFHSLWIRPMANIMQAFSVSVVFGMVIVSLGIVFSMINSLRDKDYIKLIFDKAGLIAGLFYWAVLACLTKLIVFKSDVPAGYIGFACLMLGMLLIKPFIEAAFKKHHDNIFVNFIEVFVEVIIAYSVNTVSFVRVAAFSLAHAGLFIAVFLLASMVDKSGRGGFSWLIMLSGNILIIGLEGLIVTIQSLRLNYYEFFSKFFQTGKRFYKPLTI
jgi:V/A-type H+-transporting ATPase subunit I